MKPEIIDEDGEELIKIICGFISNSLEEALEEVEERELLDDDVDSITIASKHLNKCFSYMEAEGWTEGK